MALPLPLVAASALAASSWSRRIAPAGFRRVQTVVFTVLHIVGNFKFHFFEFSLLQLASSRPIAAPWRRSLTHSLSWGPRSAES
eukprot:10538828-Alexandrium_andersonii.AAC.1